MIKNFQKKRQTLRVPVQPKAETSSESPSYTPAPKPRPQAPKAPKAKTLDHSTATTDAGVKVPPAEALDGDPISLLTGEEVLSLTDFVIEGPVPLEWKRTYRSSNQSSSALGFGWQSLFSERLLFSDPLNVSFLQSCGRKINFPRPTQVGMDVRNTTEALQLIWLGRDEYCIRQKDQPDKIFRPSVGGSYYQLSRVQNRSGYGWSFKYDRNIQSHGIPKSIQSDWGVFIECQHKSGLLTALNRVLDNEQKDVKPLVKYGYSGVSQEDSSSLSPDLIIAQDALGHKEIYRYKNHLLIRRTLKTGFSYHFKWDQYNHKGRCLKQWGDNGSYESYYTWDDVNNITEVKDSRGGVTKYQFNDRGQVLEVTYPNGQIERKHYNVDGTLDAEEDGLGRRTVHLTDPQGRTRGIMEPEDHSTPASDTFDLSKKQSSTEFAEDSDDIESIKVPGPDEEGEDLSCDCEYDDKGQLKSVDMPDGKKVETSHDEKGIPCEIKDPKRGNVNITTEDNGQISEEKDQTGNVNSYEYDENGRISQASSAFDNKNGIACDHEAKEQFQHDAMGNLTSRTTAAGTENFQYTEDGLLKQHQDFMGRMTSYEYEGLSQVTRCQFPDGSIQHYHYDSERNLIGMTNSNGDQSLFKYDESERLVAEKGFDGRQQRYHYNSANEIIRHQDSGRSETLFKRDAYGRVTEKKSWVLDDPDQVQCSYFQYNPQGLLLAASNENAFVRFEYDKNKNVISECFYNIRLHGNTPIDESKFEWIHHHYDKHQRRTKTVLPCGNELTYGYQKNGLSEVWFNEQPIVQIKRDNSGLEVMRQQGDLGTLWSYDALKRLQRQTVVKEKVFGSAPLPKALKPQGAVIDREYEYNSLGALTRLKDLQRGEARYEYDVLNHLKQVSGSAEEIFEFDSSGNMLSHNQWQQHHQNNRLLRQGPFVYKYDRAGNLSFQAVERDEQGSKSLVGRYSYDAFNQLSGAQVGPKPDDHIQYYYDPLGRRIGKIIGQGHVCQQTTFLWSGDLMIQEQLGDQKTHYVYEPNSFRPLAMINQDQVFHYHLDHLGTPMEMSNDQGEIVWQAQYYAYGAVKDYMVHQVKNPLRFQGQYYDQETQLHYNRYRYYDAKQGRYIHQDPTGLLGGKNLYQYTTNPIQYIDPFGLASKECSVPSPLTVDETIAKLAETSVVDLPKVPTVNDLPAQYEEAKKAIVEPISEALPESPTTAPPEEEEKQWVEIKLLDDSGEPMIEQDYWIKDAEGGEHQGKTDKKGMAKLENLPPGDCEVSFSEQLEGWA